MAVPVCQPLYVGSESALYMGTAYGIFVFAGRCGRGRALSMRKNGKGKSPCAGGGIADAHGDFGRL